MGSTVYLYESLSSTNEHAMTMASEGAPNGTVVIADAQSGGRGRLGRVWVSPPGKNLYLSVVLRPDIEPRKAGMLPLLCAVAASEGIEAATGFSSRIKWPNDIQAGDRKLGGILCEMRTEPGRVVHVVAGIGINVNAAAKDFTKDLRDTATSLYIETKKKHRRTSVASDLLDALSAWMERFLVDGAKPVTDAWRERSSTLGQKVRVNTPAGVVAGKARDIDDEGSLMLEMKDGSLRSVSTGDVELLR
jgi:BirA family biotin operon repressor/biotin-[acetyl-CoA-carboxylase] ligase